MSRQHPIAGVVTGHSPGTCAGADVGGMTAGQCKLCWKYLNSPKHIDSLPALRGDKTLPPLATRAKNYARDTAKHIATGAKILDAEQIEARLRACRLCDYIDRHHCTHKRCGCPVAKKAMRESSDCPVRRWPDHKLQIKTLRPFESGQNVGGFCVNWYGHSGDALQHSLRGAPVFLVAGGPSINSLDLSLLQQRGITIAAVNQVGATHVRPHYWFSVDAPSHFHGSIWQDPAVAKFTRHSNNRKKQSGTHGSESKAPVRDCPNTWFIQHSFGFDPATFLTTHKPTWGGTHGRQNRQTKSCMLLALRMLYWLGSRTVFLVGADFSMKPGESYAFDEPKDARAAGTNNNGFAIMDGWFNQLKPHFAAADFRVVNCTPASRITAFPRMDYRRAVDMVVNQHPKVDSVRGMYRS